MCFATFDYGRDRQVEEPCQEDHYRNPLSSPEVRLLMPVTRGMIAPVHPPSSSHGHDSPYVLNLVFSLAYHACDQGRDSCCVSLFFSLPIMALARETFTLMAIPRGSLNPMSDREQSPGATPFFNFLFFFPLNSLCYST